MLSIIGKLINQLRTEQGISIVELSRLTGISNRRLVDIEEGVKIPSLSSIVRISRALGSPLGTFLDGSQERIGAVVTRKSEITHEPFSESYGSEDSENLNYYSLARGKQDRRMEPFIVEVSDNAAASSRRSEHEGEEFIYVLEGSIKLMYKREEFVLESGDSIYFDPTSPHSIVNNFEKNSKILLVSYSPY